MWISKRGITASTALLLTMAAVGCGSDDEATSSTPATDSAPKAADKTPTGEPIVLYDITDTSGAGSISAVIKQFPDASQAAVDYINKELGGVGGRPFKLVKCDSKADPAATTACANEAIKDGAVAKIGISVLWDNGNKVFARAGVPSINAPVTNSDSVSPTSFPFGGGAASEIPGAVQYFATKLGKKKGVMLADDNPQGQVQADLALAAAKKVGMQLDVVKLPIGSDPTPSVARTVGLKPDVVFTQAAGSAAVTVYRAFQQQGFPADKIVDTGAAVDEDAFFSKVDKSTIEGAYFSYEFEAYDDLKNPDVALYRRVMKDYSDTDGRSEFYQWGFTNVMTIYNIVKKIGAEDFDAKKLLKFLKTVEGFPVFMGAELSASSAPKEAPQIIQPAIRMVQYKGGKVVPADGDGFFNPLK